MNPLWAYNHQCPKYSIKCRSLCKAPALSWIHSFSRHTSILTELIFTLFSSLKNDKVIPQAHQGYELSGLPNLKELADLSVSGSFKASVHCLPQQSSDLKGWQTMCLQVLNNKRSRNGLWV